MSAFLSVLLFFSSFSVKASTITLPPFPDIVEDFSSTHYLIVYNSETKRYKLIMPKDPLGNVYFVNYMGNGIIRFQSGAMSYIYKEGESNWSTGIKHLFRGNISLITDDNEYIVASSFDVYNEDGTIFFQKAPIKESLYRRMREVEMGAMMMTVVYLIPLLIVLLVSLIAFRKAWAWLLKVLRTA
jgi:hypothetical protein